MGKVQALAQRSAMCSWLFCYSEHVIHIVHIIAWSPVPSGPSAMNQSPIGFLAGGSQKKNISLCLRELIVLAVCKGGPTGRLGA